MEKKMQWLLRVDKEIWGYVDTLEDANWFLTKIAKDIGSAIGEKHPKWVVSTQNIGTDKIKVRCLSQGYMYNSKWTAHTVYFEQVLKLRKDPADTAHIPDPPSPPSSEN